jgi:hypothetical protein
LAAGEAAQGSSDSLNAIGPPFLGWDRPALAGLQRGRPTGRDHRHTMGFSSPATGDLCVESNKTDSLADC